MLWTVLRLCGGAGLTPPVVIMLEPEEGCDHELSGLKPWPNLLDQEGCLGWKGVAGALIRLSPWTHRNVGAERGHKMQPNNGPYG